MSDEQVEESLWFKAFLKHYQEAILKEHNPTANNPQQASLQTAKLPKSPQTPRTRKDPQVPESVRRSPQHLHFGKFTMDEKGKMVRIDSDEEAKESPTYVEELNPEGDPIQPVRRPKYMPPRKGNVKVPANLDEVDTLIVTPSLPKAMPVENSVVGCVSTMKFEDWDHANHEKFPHLETRNLMK